MILSYNGTIALQTGNTLLNNVKTSIHFQLFYLSNRLDKASNIYTM